MALLPKNMPAAGGSTSASSTATGGILGLFRNDPLGAAFTAGGLALMALNAALLVLERRGGPPRR